MTALLATLLAASLTVHAAFAGMSWWSTASLPQSMS
jgi:hypothetical protein